MIDPAAEKLETFAPFRAMQIRVLELDAKWRRVRIRLPLCQQNANPGGTMFGGAIAALADPIAAIACSKHFPDYTLWTKSLTLEFKRPGTSDLELVFELPPSALDKIADDLQAHGRSDHSFHYGVYLGDGTLCCRVSCVVAVRTPEQDSHRRGFRNQND